MTIAFRAVLLPDDVEREVCCVDGRLTFEQPPRDAETIGGRLYAIPGLVDAHCHIGMDTDGPADLVGQAIADRDSGVLLARDAGSPVDNRMVQERDDLPRLIRAGQHIARTRRYLPDVAIEVEPNDLVGEVEHQAALGDGWVKIVGDWIDRDVGDLAPLWPLDVLTSAVSRAHELGVRVTTHCYGTSAVQDSLIAGVDCLEHAPGLTPELAEQAQRAGVAVVPTRLNVARFPEFARAGEARFPKYASTIRALHDHSTTRLRTAFEIGVPIFAGTDCGGTEIPHGSIVAELLAMQGLGMSNTEVLAAGSWGAREWLGMPGLVEGAPADVVLYDADPRADLEVLRTPVAIILRGRRVL